MDNVHREAVTGVGMGQEFPVAEMSGQDQRAGVPVFFDQAVPLVAVGKANALGDIVRGEGVEMAEFRDQAPEVEPAVAENPGPLSRLLVGKSQGQIGQPDPSVGPVQPVQQPPDSLAKAEGQGKRQLLEKEENAPQQTVLTACQQPVLLTGGADDLFLAFRGVGLGHWGASMGFILTVWIRAEDEPHCRKRKSRRLRALWPQGRQTPHGQWPGSARGWPAPFPVHRWLRPTR